MAVTIEDSEDDRLLPALSTKSVSVGFRAITQFSSEMCIRDRAQVVQAQLKVQE